MRLPAARALPFATSLVAALVLAMALAGVVAAAVTGQQITTLATTTYQMSCKLQITDEACSGVQYPWWNALITPASGTLTKLTTDASTRTAGSDGVTEPWLRGMHGTACGDKAAANAFAMQLVALPLKGTLGPTTVGNCTTTGSYHLDVTGAPDVQMVSVVHPPKATPKPTPKPTPTPTASPVPTPTIEPSVSPTLAPSPGATTQPTEAPTATPGPTSGIGPVAVPTPGASQAPPPAGGGTGTGPTFSSSVLALEDINLDGAAVGGSALLALLLLLFMGFPAELFNDTVEQNYDQISGWFKRGPLGRVRRLGGRVSEWTARHRRAGLVGFVALAALVTAFVDPELGPNCSPSRRSRASLPRS
jgi:hypothetical protein